MKIILRTLFIFLFCLLFQTFASSSVNNVSYYPTTYIQNENQKVVLVSENLSGSEIFSKDENQNQDFNPIRLLFVNSNSESRNILLGKSEKIANANIHNLSTNNLKSKYIRAP